MADRTPLQLIVADVPEDQAPAITAIIAEYDLGLEFELAEHNELHLGKTYGNNEVICGSAAEIATALQTRAPGTSFEVWEDPRYEWLGDLYRFTPALGVWSSECDSTGEAVFTSEQVRGFIASARLDSSSLNVKIGDAHRDALIELQEHNADVVLTFTPDGE